MGDFCKTDSKTLVINNGFGKVFEDAGGKTCGTGAEIGNVL